MISLLETVASRSRSSPILWRTWFEAGLAAIDRQDYTAATKWLGEALEHVSAGSTEDRLHAITQGHLAYALWRLA